MVKNCAASRNISRCARFRPSSKRCKHNWIIWNTVTLRYLDCIGYLKGLTAVGEIFRCSMTHLENCWIRKYSYLRLSSLSWRKMSRISRFSESMGNTHRLFCEKHDVPRTLSSGAIRLADFPRTHHNNNAWRNQDDDDRERCFSIRIPRTDHISEWWTNQNESKCAQSAREGHNFCSRIRARLVTTKSGTDQRQQTEGEMDLHRTENDRIIQHERTSCIPMFLPTGERPAQMQMWSRNCSLQSRPEYSRITEENDSGSESVYRLPRCVDLVHPSAEDASGWAWFGLNFSVDEVATFVQHGALDLAGATRWRHANQNSKAWVPFFSGEARFLMTVSVGQTFLTTSTTLLEILGNMTICRECTKWKRRERKQAKWDDKWQHLYWSALYKWPYNMEEFASWPGKFLEDWKYSLLFWKLTAD